MTIQILVSENTIIPFIENVDSYYFTSKIDENISNIQKSSVSDIILDGIIINCIPSINDISFPKSNFFINTLTFLKKNNKGYIKNNFQNDFKINQYSQIKEEKKKDSLFNDDNISITDFFNQTNISKKYTSITTLNNSLLKNDIKFEKILGVNTLFNDSLLIYPDIVSILNNQLENQFLIDPQYFNYYINHINYPINHSSYFRFEEGIHLEPFSISNMIQFKNLKDLEYNKFNIDIDQTKSSRDIEIVFSNKKNEQLKPNFASFFDNNNIGNNFLVKSSITEIESYVERYLEDSNTNTVFDLFGNLTKNYKYKIKNINNKKTVYGKNFISVDSYIFSKDQKNSIKPFQDNNKNIIYSNQNYNDLTFKEIFKNNKLIENIQNEQSNIYYEKNEKFSSCGFDWSYTNSIGKNSIAFKGLE